jgi:Xaa-Pro aminopeptidase
MKTSFKLTDARKHIEEMGLDCAIATSQDNVYYTSGSHIMTISMLKRLAAIFLPLDNEPVFGVHANEEVTARDTTWIEDIRVYEGGEWEPLKGIDFVAGVLKEKGLAEGKIGVETFDIPALCMDHLRSLLPKAEFIDCQNIFDKLRSVKSTEELKHLSESNMSTAKAISIAFEMARPGDTERDVAKNMMELVVEYGADSVAFMTLGAGPNIWETHHVPDDYALKKGDLMHTDFGGYFDGYFSDISRMAVVGKPNQEQLKAYDVAVRAEWVTAEAMMPGVKVIDVHNAVKEYYESQGLPYNRAFIGHSIGIGCHEYPFLGPAHGNWELKEGMFFEVEPSCTIGQARIHTEDAFIVTKNGGENVSQYWDISNLQVIK